MAIKLGQTVTDQLTGFSGVALGRCEYITGCNQVLVQPRLKADGDFVEPRWLDEDRMLVAANIPVVELNRVSPGFDKPPPPRTPPVR